MSYRTFKIAVIKNADYQCENPHCDANADQVHHFLKQSTFPQYKEDPDNGMAVCGLCHSEIERREREGENVVELMPVRRLRKMLDKAGVKPEKYEGVWD